MRVAHFGRCSPTSHHYVPLGGAELPGRRGPNLSRGRGPAVPQQPPQQCRAQHQASTGQAAGGNDAGLPASTGGRQEGWPALNRGSSSSCSRGLTGRRQALWGSVAMAAATLVPLPLSGSLTGLVAAAAEGEGEAAQAVEAFCLVAPPGATVPSPPPPLGASAGGSSLPRYASVAEAVAACPEGGVVLVAAGRYRERLVLSRAVTVRAWPQDANVELVWETQEPYQSTVEVSGGGGGGGGSSGPVVLEGITIRHASKSVANNFGVYIRGGCAPQLIGCDISSATGAGVGVEGASPQLLSCRIHDCARQGVAIFGGGAELMMELGLDPDVLDAGLLSGLTGGLVQGCDVYGNALDGVLVRSGASPDLLDNRVHNNKGVGVNLQDCGGRYSGNTVYDNARGAVSVSALFELDAGDIAGSNSLKGLFRRL